MQRLACRARLLRWHLWWVPGRLPGRHLGSRQGALSAPMVPRPAAQVARIMPGADDRAAPAVRCRARLPGSHLGPLHYIAIYTPPRDHIQDPACFQCRPKLKAISETKDPLASINHLCL